MVETQGSDREGADVYFDEENPYQTDILDRPDLFYGNPDDMNEEHPSYAYGDDPDGYNGYGGYDDVPAGGSFDAAAIRGMVRNSF